MSEAAARYEADNIGRIYKIAGSEVLPTGRTVAEWASRSDITEEEYDQHFAAPSPGDATDPTLGHRTASLMPEQPDVPRTYVPRTSDSTSAATTRKAKRKPRRAKQLGISDADYARMLAAQDGMCAIPACLRTPKTRRFHVDHDHATGQVRGLLCHWHNRILPKTSDEAYAMAAYLARYEP